MTSMDAHELLGGVGFVAGRPGRLVSILSSGRKGLMGLCKKDMCFHQVPAKTIVSWLVVLFVSVEPAGRIRYVCTPAMLPPLFSGSEA